MCFDIFPLCFCELCQTADQSAVVYGSYLCEDDIRILFQGFSLVDSDPDRFCIIDQFCTQRQYDGRGIVTLVEYIVLKDQYGSDLANFIVFFGWIEVG